MTRFGRETRPARGGAALPLALLLGFGGGAAQAANYTVKVLDAMDIGTVASAESGDTVFRVNPATGLVTVVSGTGHRLSTQTVQVRIDVTCKPSGGGDTDCTTKRVPIRVSAVGSATGRARPSTAFYVSGGTAQIASTPTGTAPLSFELAPLGANSTKTFFLGADFPVAGDNSGLPAGDGANSFDVMVLSAAGAVLDSDGGAGRVQAIRSLAVDKTSDLAFGRVQRPTTGSNTITIAANNGARTLSGAGNAVLIPTPAPTRAAFTVRGEGAQQVSISVPASINLTGPGTLALSVNHTAPASARLSGRRGELGTLSFNVGASFSVSSTTPVGTYTGSVVVSADYN